MMFQTGLHQQSLSNPAIQEPGVNPPLSLDIDDFPRKEIESIRKCCLFALRILRNFKGCLLCVLLKTF